MFCLQLFSAAAHISRVNCTGISRDKLELSTYEIFSIERTSVFFNLFAAAEPYTSVKVTHGTPCALIRESSDVREVEAISSV